MKTIRFLETCTLRDLRVGTCDQESYAQGQLVILRDDQAWRWIRRGKAVEVEPLLSLPQETAWEEKEMEELSENAVLSDIPEEEKDSSGKQEEEIFDMSKEYKLASGPSRSKRK